MSEVAKVTTCNSEWDFQWIRIEDLEGILNQFKPERYHPDDPRYNLFWQTIRSKCIEGIWYPQFGQYRYVPGRLGFYGNYCTIVETDKKTKARLKLKPSIRDIEWHISYYYLEAQGFSGFEDDDEYTCNWKVLNPDAYHMSATISTPIDVALSDRIMIEIYCIKISGGNVNLNTYFEGSYYSFIQTTLNAGTTLLTSSNNWTGNNSFALSPTAPTPTVNDISTKIATTEFISTALTPYLTSSSAADTYASLNSPTFTQSITANGGILLNSPQTLSGSGSISLTGNISTPTLTSISGLNIGTTATSITIGASSIPTTINGNLTMGETGTIYTTSGQQIRLGHANTQASGTTISSFGPFFKSFGPASVSGTTYDILYEGTNGLFTPTGLNGVGGFLTIVISNKTSSEKIATLTYNVAKRVGITGIQSLTAMTHVFGGWTTIPTIGAGVGNDIRITFHAADWTNSTVSWMFMGSI